MILCGLQVDPQYMHVDEEKANKGRFNGIIASGTQTLAISFKLWIEEGLYGDDVIAGTEMNHITFIKPVFPDDELHTIVEVLDKQPKRNNWESSLYCYLLIIKKKKKYLKVSYRY